VDHGGLEEHRIARPDPVAGFGEGGLRIVPAAHLDAAGEEELRRGLHQVTAVGEELQVGIVVQGRRVAVLLVEELGRAFPGGLEIGLGEAHGG